MEVDIYDEEDINYSQYICCTSCHYSDAFYIFLQLFVSVLLSRILSGKDSDLQYSPCHQQMSNACKCVWYLGAQAEGVQYHPPNTSWPNPDIMKTIPFDYTIHDPKYDDISSVYSPGYKPSAEGRYRHNTQMFQVFVACKSKTTIILSFSPHLSFPCCLSKERLFVRRMCTYADGHLGSSCLNMQPTTPTTTVNSVISTWASIPDIRWAGHNKHTIWCIFKNVNVTRWCWMSPLISCPDVWVNTACIHIHPSATWGRDPAVLHHPKV